MYNLNFEALDSFIIKHRINYNTTVDDIYTNEPFKMLFIDYDLARKSQPSNSENFDSVIDNTPINDINNITMTYYDKSYTIYLDGEDYTTNTFNNTNVIDNVTGNTQNYFINNINDFNVNDIIEINIYQYYTTTGSTEWYHTGLANEIWYVSGFTEHQTQWELTGRTTMDGNSSGFDYWTVDEKIPILTYSTTIRSKNGNYILIDRLLQKFIYNNLLSTPYLNYEITTLNHSNKDFFNLSIKLLKSPFGKYFDVDIDNPVYNMVINPKRNENDVYFDYDKLFINFNLTNSTTLSYSFYTDNIYNKYTMEEFFNELNISGQTNIMMPYNRFNSSYTYTGQTNIILTFISDIDIEIFKKYTYVKIHTNLNDYTTLIIDINDNVITLEKPTNITIGEYVSYIYNIPTIEEISDILQMCYENVDNDFYKKRELNILNKIYLSYADVINIDSINSAIRQSLTGIIYENENKKLTLKIYNPSESVDNDVRLLYRPFEITRIGKDRKTNIPIQIYDYSFEFLFNILDGSSIETETMVDSNESNDIIIDSNIQ